MEEPLRRHRLGHRKRAKGVAILIIMEEPLRPGQGSYTESSEIHVAILIIMEEPLRPMTTTAEDYGNNCRNPYYNGRASKTLMLIG